MRQSAEVDHFCHELQQKNAIYFSCFTHNTHSLSHRALTRRLLCIIGFSILFFIFYSMLDHMSPFRHVVIMDISAIFSTMLAQSLRHFLEFLWRVCEFRVIMAIIAMS